MRKISEVKYPQAARLFDFCKNVLDDRHGPSRVIDQDVGQLLGFDPSDCSHWKKGRKQVKSIDALRALAEQLRVDERLVLDVASGQVTPEEGMLEFRGSQFYWSTQNALEAVKREWQRNNNISWDYDLEKDLKRSLSVDVDLIESIVNSIHERLAFKEAPFFLPEISTSYPVQFTLYQDQSAAEEQEQVAWSRVRGERSAGGFRLHCAERALMRPVMRFYIVETMAPYFLDDSIAVSHPLLRSYENQLRKAYYREFAMRFLVPTRLIYQEMERVELRKNLVDQLSQVFWVSHRVMNVRLREALTGDLRMR